MLNNGITYENTDFENDCIFYDKISVLLYLKILWNTIAQCNFIIHTFNVYIFFLIKHINHFYIPGIELVWGNKNKVQLGNIKIEAKKEGRERERKNNHIHFIHQIIAKQNANSNSIITLYLCTIYIEK